MSRAENNINSSNINNNNNNRKNINNKNINNINTKNINNIIIKVIPLPIVLFQRQKRDETEKGAFIETFWKLGCGCFASSCLNQFLLLLLISLALWFWIEVSWLSWAKILEWNSNKAISPWTQIILDVNVILLSCPNFLVRPWIVKRMAVPPWHCSSNVLIVPATLALLMEAALLSPLPYRWLYRMFIVPLALIWIS